MSKRTNELFFIVFLYDRTPPITFGWCQNKKGGKLGRQLWYVFKIKLMNEENKLNITNSVQVLVAPWERGFTCGVIINSSSKMTSEQYEMCSTVARGMIKLATEEPHKVFTQGIKGFVEDRKNKSIPKNIECIAESTHDGKEEAEVIDFIEAIKERRDKQLS